jgi:hypothetical protein
MEVVVKNPVVGMKTHGMDYVEIDGVKFKRTKDNNFCHYLSLHQYLIIKAFGSLPKNMDIHHKDFDKDNNFLSNYEILTRKEHIEKHNLLDKVEIECSICRNRLTRRRSIAYVDGINKYCSEECRRLGSEKKKKEWVEINREKVLKSYRDYYSKRDKSKLDSKRRAKRARKKLLVQPQPTQVPT